MSENKVNICTILDTTYIECHDIIKKSLQDDLYTLYSCIRVNRFFCRIFVPILWRNPFKFVKKDEQLIEIFNTLIHCLDQSVKERLINKELIDIMELPTPNTYFKYHTFIREFELHPLQKGMRLWTTKYLLRTHNDFQSSNGKGVGKKVVKLNNYIGNLLFNKGNQYESLNISYNDLLSGPRTLFDICEVDNYEESLIKVNKLSLGLCHKNNTDLIPHIIKKILKLQNALSPNIQHLQICIEMTRQNIELSKELINLIQYQQNLKSLSIDPLWKHDEIFNSFLVSLQKQSKSLTFLKLRSFRTYIINVFSILKLLPNLITLDLELLGSIIGVSEEIPILPASHFNNLKHLCYNSKVRSNILLHMRLIHSQLHNNTNNQIDTRILLFKQILLSSINLKTLKVAVTYCPTIKQVQQQFPLNITHFHLVLTSNYPFDELVIILTNFERLVHLKLSSPSEYFLHQLGNRQNNQNNHNHSQHHSLDSDNLFRKFLKALAQSLKILEVNFTITDKHLEILFNESQLNIQCIKLYRYLRCSSDSLLRVFIEYAIRKNCFKELGIHRDIIRHFSNQYVEEAKNHFDITLDNNIDNPFYDVPINNSCWSK